MSKVLKALKAVSLILQRPVLLNRVLQEPDLWKEHVGRQHNMQQGLPVVNPTHLFGADYQEKLHLFTFLDGGSLVTDIALLKGLARQFPQCRYFEIGTWRGESAVNLAQVASEVYTLNLPDDELRKIGVSDASIKQQSLFSKRIENITHLKSHSAKFDFSSTGKKFDLVFIDGSHHYEDVKNDTEKVFKHLIHDQSVVVWHDYSVTPEDIRYEVFAGILDGLPHEAHQYLYHVAHTKSAIFYRKKLETGRLTTPVNPDHYYSVDIKYNSIENR